MSFADEKATEVLRSHWNGRLPVDVKEIAGKLGVAIIEREEYGAVTPPEGIARKDTDDHYDISGRFDIVNGIPTATIRTTDALVRQRFTLAHELGHYILGHGGGFRDNAAAVVNFTNYNQAEIDANAFAAELLMPKLMVNHLIEAQNIRNIEALASKFFVSTAAMEYRLKKLGWL